MKSLTAKSIFRLRLNITFKIQNGNSCVSQTVNVSSFNTDILNGTAIFYSVFKITVFCKNNYFIICTVALTVENGNTIGTALAEKENRIIVFVGCNIFIMPLNKINTVRFYYRNTRYITVLNTVN